MTELTLDLVARFPRPGMAVPGKPAFTHNGRLLTWLHAEEDGLHRVLWAHDVATGETRVLFRPPGAGATDENVSREEALRRERQRLRETGVTHYAWASAADVLMVPIRGEVWTVTNGSKPSLAARGAIDPHLSRDGRLIAFVRDGELYAVDAAAGTERRLTHDAQPGVTNGLAEYVAQEEMGRASGFWISRDGAWIAYEQADERGVPEFGIPHWGQDAPDEERHRYPFAGGPNVKVRLGVVASTGGPTTWLDLGDAEYLARVAWHPDGRLFVQLQNRDQTRLELRAFDVRSGRAETLLVEESASWVNLHHDLRFLPETGEFVWASERTGWKHLYLHAPDGRLIRPITTGDWPVDSVCGVDAKGRRVAFTGSTNPVEKHVFIASLEGGEPRRLTSDPGMHDAVFAPSLDTWLEVADSRSRPPLLRLHGPERVVHPPAEVRLPLVTPELLSFQSRDGETLRAMLYKPVKLPAPLVVAVYGGPHVQMVQDAWANTVDLRAQYLASKGLLVLKLDNRGSARRGLAFESRICRRMGTIEVDDQVDGVRFAQRQGWVDGERVGVYGWSYGGYMTLLCMTKAADVFRVGVAGAPVTAWDGYDTHYTERYMRTPQANRDGYREGSVLEHASKLRGRLLLIHGMIDENVHFRHTARLLRALSAANLPYDLLVYPEERHMPRSERDRRNLEERVADYFLRWL